MSNTGINMPSNTVICVDWSIIGVLRLHVKTIIWYGAAKRDDSVVVGMLRHGTAAVTLAFGIGPPLERIVWSILWNVSITEAQESDDDHLFLRRQYSLVQSRGIESEKISEGLRRKIEE